MKDNGYDSQLSCAGCWERRNPSVGITYQQGLDDAQVIEAVGLKPPKY